MKSFKSYIKEASGFPTSPGIESPNNLGGSLEVNPTDVGDPAMLKRLNAIVGTTFSLSIFILSYLMFGEGISIRGYMGGFFVISGIVIATIELPKNKSRKDS